MYGLEDSLVWPLTWKPVGLPLLRAPEDVALRYFLWFRADQHMELNAAAVLMGTEICHDPGPLSLSQERTWIVPG